MKKTLLCILLFATFCTGLRAQGDSTVHHHTYNIGFGWNTRHDSTLIGKFNIGLFPVVDSLRGFQAGLFIGGVNRHASGFMLAGIENASHSLHGIQLAAVGNQTFSPMQGIQLGTLTNMAMGVDYGMQLSALTNISSGTVHGLQLSSYNYADTLNGSQVGLINVAIKHPKGVQIGLVNYTRDTLAHKIGLVNINPKTKIDVLLGLGTSSKINAAMRFRNRSTYSIIGVGTHYMGFDDDFSGTLYYRLGQYFTLSKRWSLSGDLGFYHIETMKKNSEDTPERLYSLQAHINVDYDISPHLGAYASVGFGTTRHYGTHHNYRTRPLIEAGLALHYAHDSQAEQKWLDERERDMQWHLAKLKESPTGKLFRMDDSTYTRNRWLPAIVEATGINVLVHCFDRFILNEDFAQVHFKDIAHNWRHAFVWDNDQFSTNLFAHPYHGNLYFNSARSNGLNFWQSTPFALGGSLMWEFCGEVEPPAINDLLATTFGGICIGEITHRISALILNDHTRGRKRFWREFAATVINPMQGLTRICNGDAWKVRDEHYLYHDFSRIPVEFIVTLGDRYLADEGHFARGEHQPYLETQLYYGDAFDSENNKPYDYFTADLSMGFTGNQPFINGLHLLGKLWSATYYNSREGEMLIGIFQHFNYYDSKPVKDGSSQTPYRISEAASFGPGAIWRFPKMGNLGSLRQEMFIDAIILGGTKSDYYNVIDRDYNMGSGYSFKLNTIMLFPRTGAFSFFVDYYHIYTWKGYEGKDLENTDPLYLNAQGDKSNAQLLVLRPKFLFQLKHDWGVELSGTYFARRTHYKYHDNVRTQTFEVRAGLVYRL
jgi:hypothetical protein